jgi:hypothetical protein
MSVSLDGFIADPDDFLGGEDGERLRSHLRAQPPAAESGRRAGPWRTVRAADRATLSQAAGPLGPAYRASTGAMRATSSAARAMISAWWGWRSW